MFERQKIAKGQFVKSRLDGFTIVELLIVVVVIAILAAITIVSYNGITQRATEVSLKSDLRNAATLLELDNTNSGAYPSSASAANAGGGLKSSDSNQFQYSYEGSDNSYCLSVTTERAGGKSFNISNTTGQVAEGVCLGHTPAAATTAGETWTNRTIAANTWSDVAFGNGQFVAVAGRGVSSTSVASRSSDGQTWSTPTEIGTLLAYDPSVIYAGNKFVVGFETGRGESAISFDNGQSWQHNPMPASGASYIIRTLAYGGGSLVGLRATLPDASLISVRTSGDGLTWVNTSTGIPYSNFNAVVYGNGRFVAVGNGTGTRIITSDNNGVTWVPRTAPEANTYTSVTYGKGLFVAVSSSGTNRVMTSPDGITWTMRPVTEASGWSSVTYGGGKFVAVASSGTNRVMTSTDGINWNIRSASQANPWSAVTYGNGCFVATANSGTNRVMTSCE